MSKFQLSSTKQDDDDEGLDAAASTGGYQIDLDSVDASGDENADEEALTKDGEYLISGAFHPGEPQGLSAKQRAAKQERLTLAANETRAIFCLRLVVLLTLMILGISFALVLFKYTNARKEQEFEEQFGFYRDQVIEKFNRQLERKLNAMDTLSSEITSHAKSSGSEFPFVTVPDFEFRGANARISGDAVAIFYTPYITEDIKVPWETYSTANQVYNSMSLQHEEESKIAQDQLFGLKPPKIDGLAGEYLELLESLNGTSLVDTSKIWTNVMDGNNVSGLLVYLERQIVPHTSITVICDSRRLLTFRFGNIPHRYRLKLSILI